MLVVSAWQKPCQGIRGAIVDDARRTKCSASGPVQRAPDAVFVLISFVVAESGGQ